MLVSIGCFVGGVKLIGFSGLLCWLSWLRFFNANRNVLSKSILIADAFSKIHYYVTHEKCCYAIRISLRIEKRLRHIPSKSVSVSLIDFVGLYA